MTRALVVLLGGLLLAGAGPRPSLPLPPPLPTDPPTDQAAPVPEYDPRFPAGFARDPNSTEWALRMYRMEELDTGEGYIPGSAYQSPEQRRPMQTPGFMVTVPLQ